MNRDNQYLIRQTVICLLLGVLVVSSSVLAQWSRREDSNRQSRTSEEDMQREERRQQALQSFPELNGALEAILKNVSINQRPQPEAINRAAELLEENKRNGSFYDDKQKNQFMLLRAWTDYYQDNLTDALRWSMRACKTYEASQDAWISQAVFSMLEGKRPMLPRMDKPKERPERPQSSRRRNVESPIGIGSSAKPYSERGELQFDLLNLKTELFREQFDRMEYSAVDGSEIEYVPGKDVLCILFWQDNDEKISDSNDISPREPVQQQSAQPMPPMAMEMMGMPMGDGAYGTKEVTLQTQRNYMGMLKEACQNKPEIKFIQINTNKPEAAKIAAQKIASDPLIAKAGSLVFAADPASKAQAFMGIEAVDPFMMIIDTEGKVRYAGPAADFVPAFILTELTGVELDLEKMNQAQLGQPPMQEGAAQPAQTRPTQSNSQTSKRKQPPVMLPPGMMLPEMGMPTRTSPKPVVDPNATDPNAVRVRVQPARTSKLPSSSPHLSMEDQIRAEKLLQAAQLDIGTDGKLRSNPKKGIEACRKILAQFPNTQYAEQARELLRKVPERYKKMNNITDEELGL